MHSPLPTSSSLRTKESTGRVNLISTGDLKNGMTIELDGALWNILDFHHIKMGRGSAQMRLKMRNVRTGTTIERSFQAGEKFRRAYLDRKTVQFLYREGDIFHFMDTESFEQVALDKELLGSDSDYLGESQTLDILTYRDEAIGAELPAKVELAVAETDPGFRGDTSSGGSKPAVLQTGLSVQVPLFVNEGDVIRVDTRTGAYVERV